MMATIGGRYLVFSTLFGTMLYWVCGGVLVASGVLAVYVDLAPFFSALLGGSIEAAFMLVVFLQQREARAD